MDLLVWTVSGTTLHFADWTDWTGWTCIEVDYCGGWLCFVCSLSMIGGVTALIGSKLRSRALHFESKRKRENEVVTKQKICSFTEVIWQSFVAVQLARLRVLFTAFEPCPFLSESESPSFVL